MTSTDQLSSMLPGNSSKLPTISSRDKAYISLIPCTSTINVLKTYIKGSNVSSVYVADFAAIAGQIDNFHRLLPRVSPHYAVKCNPDPILIKFLAQVGVSFDCASKIEVDLVKTALGAAHGGHFLNDRIIFANPCKPIEDIKYLRAVGASLMTFDNVDELIKISKHYHKARLVLRLATNDSQSLQPLSAKYGAQMHELPEILQTIEDLSLNLVGASFHTGSGCNEVEAYTIALHDVRILFDMAAERGIHLSIVDIGGGFPGFDGETKISFKDICDAIYPKIRSLFPQRVKIIAEPGRFVVKKAYKLATRILLIREGEERKYYVADGITRSFRDAHLLKERFEPKVLKCRTKEEKLYPSIVHGSSREPGDVICKDVMLPKLEAGDWLFFDNMGAYTTSLAACHPSLKNDFTILHCFSSSDHVPVPRTQLISRKWRIYN